MSILPECLQDTTNLALEECMQKAFTVDMSKFMTCVVDSLDENILYYLAERFHMTGDEGWNKAKNKKEKIRLVKNALIMHKKKGTLGIINKVAETSELKAQYINWTEYNGTPHHYKIAIDYIGKSYSELDEYKLLKQIDEFKQLRAKLDNIDITIGNIAKTVISSAVFMGEVIEIKIERNK